MLSPLFLALAISLIAWSFRMSLVSNIFSREGFRGGLRIFSTTRAVLRSSGLERKATASLHRSRVGRIQLAERVDVDYTGLVAAHIEFVYVAWRE